MPATVIEADFRTIQEPSRVVTLDLHDGQEVKLPSGEPVFVRLWSRGQLDERGRQLAVAVRELNEDVERGGERVSPAYRKAWAEWRAAVGEDLAGGPRLSVLERQEGVLGEFRGLLRKALAAAPAPATGPSPTPAAAPAGSGGQQPKGGWPLYIVIPGTLAAGFGIWKGMQWIAEKFFTATTTAVPTPREEARHVGTE